MSNITYEMARKRLGTSKAVYAEYFEHNIEQRDRVLRIIDHGDEITLKVFRHEVRLPKHHVAFFDS